MCSCHDQGQIEGEQGLEKENGSLKEIMVEKDLKIKTQQEFL